MGSMEETQRSALKIARFPNTLMLFKYLDSEILNYRRTRFEDLIPHQVLSHGFMEWLRLLRGHLPSLAWRGRAAESDQGITFDEYERFLYNRFFLRIAELPSLGDKSEEEKAKLKEEGWKEYLED